MSTEDIIIRDASTSDLETITVLMNELGYPTTLPEMQTRFAATSIHPDYKAIVADLNGRVVGMAGLCKSIYYEKNGWYLRIVCFIVDEQVRQRGIGKMLINTAEQWALQNGMHTSVLTSGNRDNRIAAHIFYQKMGYEIKSSGFIKHLV